MERTVAKFSSHEEADRAEWEYYRWLSPGERLRILLELSRRFREGGDASSERLERVYRIAELSSG